MLYRPPAPRKAFTLIELLAVIAILAVLVTAAGVYIANYIRDSKRISNQRTLATLNDALNRYKCEGGSLSALTTETPIANVLAALQSPITWAGTTHQVMQAGKTFLSRSISATGSGKQYHFTRYDTFTAEAGGTSQGGGYGAGVGYMSNGSAQDYCMWGQSTTGWIAYKDNNDNIHYGSTDYITLPAANSYTFWSCAGDGDPTPSGEIINLGLSYHDPNIDDVKGNQLTALDVRGLTQLQSLECWSNLLKNKLTAFDASGLTQLQYLGFNGNQLTSLNISGCDQLRTLYCAGCQLTSSTIDSILAQFVANGDSSGAVDFTGQSPAASPGTQGWTDKATLESRGWTVNVDGSPPTPTYTGEIPAAHGTMANGGTQDYVVQDQSSSSWIAYKDNKDNIFYSSGSITLPAANSYTFWSCAGDGDPTPSGDIVALNYSNSSTGIQLTSLDVSGLTQLQSLDCSYNGLTSIDVSGLTQLQYFWCGYGYNQLTLLDFSGCTSLFSFNCDRAGLTSLDVSGLTQLYYLSCGGNQLTSLDVSGLTQLEGFWCWDNQLGPINVTGCPLSQYFDYSGNPDPVITGP